MPLLSAIKPRSSALAALLLLLGARPAGASMQNAFTPGSVSSDKGSLEASWTTLTLSRDQLNEASDQAGFPGISNAVMQLWGGGAMIQKGVSRYGVMGMTGGLASDQGGQFSNWGLNLVGIVAEQRYGGNGWEVTAGFFAGYGEFDVEYRDGGGYSRFESRFIGSGGTAGLRWPSDARMSFFLRSGYLWLPAAGAWHGNLAGKIAKTYFDLSAPFAQLGFDISF